MTTMQDSEILTRVGPGTPVGELMRHYWLPALKSSELTPDGEPIRFMLLNEKLVAFRDTEGRVGVLDQRCPHRCASLYFGRNEQGGLRCVYHGWKFGVDGACLDMPNVPPQHQFKDKVKAKSYRTAERNGIVYVYMGNEATIPSLPNIGATMIPEDQATISFVMRECNWLQALEGDIDTSHLDFLHFGTLGTRDYSPSDPTRFGAIHRDPEYKVEETEFGVVYGAYRPAENNQTYWRVAHFLFPCWTLAPFVAFEHYRVARAWVPIDDTHVMFIMISPKQGPGSFGPATPLLPNNHDWLGRFRSGLNYDNNYLMDREKQRTVSYTGIEGVNHQDQAITESMGPITDHAWEHLAISDRMLMTTRRRILAAAKALAETGATPPAATMDPVAYQGIGAGFFLAPASREWPDVYRQQIADTRAQAAE
jgi:phenylpropionate dioxygenase-like ring-hydroxylating dioxygenase large terminal subunit